MTFTYETRVSKRDGSITYTKLVHLGFDPKTGKRRQMRISASSVKELRRRWLDTQQKVHSGTYVEPTTEMTADYLTRWLAAIKPTIRPASYDRYRRVVEKQITPALGRIPLAKLTPLQVQDWYAALIAAGRSTTTVSLYHGILHRALDQAVKWGMLTRNVCDAVDAPRPNNPEMRTWTAEQARVFLAATADDELAAFWRLALYTGMRRGELLALRWADVDFERGTLSVRRTLTRGESGLVFGEPKSSAGRRSVAIPEPVVATLRTHRARQAERRLKAGPAWQDHDLVFERGDGTVLHPNVVTHTFPRLARRHGLPVIRLHDLRHTAATLMLANGEHPRIVQERLGHSDVSMTLNRYSHVTESMQRDAADRLARLLGS